MTPWGRANLLLGVLALLLVGLLLWPPTDVAYDPLIAPADRSPETIRIERDDRLVIALRRTGDRWWLEHPEFGPARPERVAQLLSVTRAAVIARFAATDLGRFGLAPPALRLKLDGTTLGFGDRDPTQRNRYVLLDDRVHVVDELYFNLASLPASHFSDD